MMESQHAVVLTQDPHWFLKLLVASVFLAVLLTVAAYLVKARRKTFLLTFPIAFVALWVSHFAIGVSLSSLGLLVATVAMMAILYLGVKYILIARPLASVVVSIGVTVLFVMGLAAALAIVGG
jgi:hypothetical protein